MKRFLAGLAVGMAIFCMSGKDASATLINFDDVASGTNINTHYAGVRFGCFNGTLSNLCSGNAGNTFNAGDAYAVSSPSASSAPNVISLTSGTPLGVFTDERFAYFSAGFSAPVSHVSINAKAVNPPEYLGGTTNHPFLDAYSSGGSWLSRAEYTGNTDLEAWETLTINSASDNIAYVVFSSFSSSGHPVYGEFDNLKFATSGDPSWAAWAGGGGSFGNWDGGTTNPSSVPEPSTLLLLGSGMVGLAATRVRKFRKS